MKARCLQELNKFKSLNLNGKQNVKKMVVDDVNSNRLYLFWGKIYMLILLFIIIGLVTGILAGLLGIGGGVITVPAMFYLFKYTHFPHEHLMHTCIATALATTLMTSIGSTISHHIKRTILFSVLKYIVPGLIVGCIFGALLSEFLSNRFLQIFFGAMSVLFAIYFFFPKLPKLHFASEPNKSLVFFGLVIGSLSSLLGVGGGIFMVPILLGYNISLKNVVASSSAGTLATAFVGTLIYLFIAYGDPTLPDSIGFVNIPAFLAIGISSLCTTTLGCKLSHTLKPELIKRIFAIALGITGLTMIFST